MSTTAHDTARFQRHDGGPILSVEERTRFFVTPIAAPSILGLFGFSGATFIVAANLAGWYGTTNSPMFLFPFAAAFGGIAQFAAALFAYRARDGVATAMHGMWGAFWMAFGLMYLLAAVKAITIPTGTFPEFGFWFLALAAITGAGAIAAFFEKNLGFVSVLAPLAAGAAFAAVHYLTGGKTWEIVAGWVLLASSWTAFYVAFAMMLHGATHGRVVLPLGKLSADANIPARTTAEPIGWALGEPGVRQGQ